MDRGSANEKLEAEAAAGMTPRELDSFRQVEGAKLRTQLANGGAVAQLLPALASTRRAAIAEAPGGTRSKGNASQIRGAGAWPGSASHAPLQTGGAVSTRGPREGATALVAKPGHGMANSSHGPRPQLDADAAAGQHVESTSGVSNATPAFAATASTIETGRPPTDARSDLLATPHRQAAISPWHTLGTKHAFVHVLCSRFCIGQGHQAALTASRLALFKSICLPSIRAQTDVNFVWIIYIDSTLSAADRAVLEQAVDDMRNVAVVALTGKAHGAVKAYEAPCTRQLELAGWGAWVRVGALPTGRRKMYLTTRLDADDGLEVHFFARLHARILRALEKRAGGPRERSKLYLCHVRAVTWFPTQGWGAGMISTEENAFRECLTPGLTLASFSSKAHSVHAIAHTEVRRRRDRTVLLLDEGGQWTGPLRARTVTSDGLKGVRSAHELAGVVGGGWHAAGDGTVQFEARYGIGLDALKRANDELVQREAAVAGERTRGKDCVEDFSCVTHLDRSALSRLMKLSGGGPAGQAG